MKIPSIGWSAEVKKISTQLFSLTHLTEWGQTNLEIQADGLLRITLTSIPTPTGPASSLVLLVKPIEWQLRTHTPTSSVMLSGSASFDPT